MEMTRVDFLVCFDQRYEAVLGLSLLENLLQSSFGRFSLVVRVAHQAFNSSAEKSAQYAVLWCTTSMERRLR